jgi:hypothetical protein
VWHAPVLSPHSADPVLLTFAASFCTCSHFVAQGKTVHRKSVGVRISTDPICQVGSRESVLEGGILGMMALPGAVLQGLFISLMGQKKQVFHSQGHVIQICRRASGTHFPEPSTPPSPP